MISRFVPMTPEPRGGRGSAAPQPSEGRGSPTCGGPARQSAARSARTFTLPKYPLPTLQGAWAFIYGGFFPFLLFLLRFLRSLFASVLTEKATLR